MRRRNNTNVKTAYEARLRRRIAAHPEEYVELPKLRAPTPEESFIMIKEQPHFHPSNMSSDHNQTTDRYNEQSCNPWNGCIPSCPFFPESGKYYPESGKVEPSSSSL